MVPKIIKLFLDLETTGFDVRKHSIHQIAGILEIDGVEVNRFDIKTQPNPKAKIEESVLRVCKVDSETILGYQPMESAHKEFKSIIGHYINRFDPRMKAYIVGYNNRSFDDMFIRAWFTQCKDEFFGSYFWSDSLDVLVLASQYLIGRRTEMPSFQLGRVAKELGIVVDDDGLHDAAYDVELTREIYQIVTGLKLEI